jgi:hypothetical protein
VLQCLYAHPLWPQGFTYTSLQVNDGSCAWHTDGPNIGWSVDMSIGDFTGGRLMFDDEYHDIMLDPLLFNGKRWHKTEDFVGHRYVMIAFTHGLFWKLNPREMDRLSALGFPLPDPETVQMQNEGVLSCFLPISQPVEDMDVGVSNVVPRGLGAPKGLSMLAHFQWAQQFSNPLASDQIASMDSDLFEAVKFECTHEASVVDEFREAQWAKIEDLAARSVELQSDWLRNNGLDNDALGTQINGAFIVGLIHLVGYEEFDPTLESDIAGFPLVGKLPRSGPESIPTFPTNEEAIGIRELVEKRSLLNEFVVSSIKGTDFDEDLMNVALDEFDHGLSAEPSLVVPGDWSLFNFCRRIPIREERAHGWRTRPVDHFTENAGNGATIPQDKTIFDNIGVMVSIILLFLNYGITPRLWKRDIAKAFRRVLIALEHRQFACSVWKINDELWKLPHNGMPFGAVSANHAWHRVGSLIRFVLRRFFLAPAGRYVDDFFGANAEGISWTSGQITTMLSDIMGYPCEEKKSEDGVFSLNVLGATVAYDMADLSVTTVIEKAKAAKWSKYIAKHLGEGSMPPGAAEKMAGRVQAAVTMSQNKVGRAFVKPLYMQVYDPRPEITPLLQASLHWWMNYLEIRPPSKASLRLDRKEIIMWTDASGESRTLGVVAAVKVEGAWSYAYTYLRVPDEIWELLLDREDKQIGYQEFLAVALGMATFAVQNCLVTNYIDNDGVLGSILKGASKCHEVNLGIGKLLMDVAVGDIGFYVARVESKANISDEPSRLKFDLVELLGASYVEPVLPSWAFEVWSWPMEDVITFPHDGLTPLQAGL